MVKLLDAALADPRIQAAAPKDSEGRGMTEALDGVLREFSPLCCFVGDEKMLAVYEQAGISLTE